MPKPVIVVGAGAAGLVCARRLKAMGVDCVVLESESTSGGKLKTDAVDGFLIDRGFQVLLTGYPALRSELSLDALDLRTFKPGFLLVDDGVIREFDGSNPVAFALSPFLGVSDKLRLIEWTAECRGLSEQQLARIDDVPTERLLRRLGFSTQFVEEFARPFLGGIFLDRSLAISSRAFATIWKALSEGDTAIPALGIQEVASQLAAGLDVRYGSEVVELTGNRRVEGVRLKSGETIVSEAVIVAADPSMASMLTGFAMPTEFRSQTTYAFDAPEAPTPEGTIMLAKMPRAFDMVVPTSNVAPERAPANRSLVTAVRSGPAVPLDEVVKDLKQWFPSCDVPSWRHLATCEVMRAQFAQPPGFAAHLQSYTPGRDGLYLAGEATVGSSLQGALQSGIECARLVAQDLSGVTA